MNLTETDGDLFFVFVVIFSTRLFPFKESMYGGLQKMCLFKKKKFIMDVHDINA